MVTIKDMEMPESCRNCSLRIITRNGGAVCAYTKNYISVLASGRLPSCPLKNVRCDVCRYAVR